MSNLRGLLVRANAHLRHIYVCYAHEMRKHGSGGAMGDLLKEIEVALAASPAEDVDVKLERLTRIETYLHRQERHPDYEYATTKGPRKSWPDSDRPPAGDGWVSNPHAGRNGWERFDFHEEAYWMRLAPSAAAAGGEDAS